MSINQLIRVIFSPINLCNHLLFEEKAFYYCCGSVAMLYTILWDPMACSTPCSPVLHHLPEFAQIYIHWWFITAPPPKKNSGASKVQKWEELVDGVCPSGEIRDMFFAVA